MPNESLHNYGSTNSSLKIHRLNHEVERSFDGQKFEQCQKISTRVSPRGLRLLTIVDTPKQIHCVFPTQSRVMKTYKRMLQKTK